MLGEVVREVEEEVTVLVTRAEGEKCVRCWVYVAQEEGGVCERCQGAVREMVEKGEVELDLGVD